MLSFFLCWLAGIIACFVYYFFVRKKYNYSLLETGVFCFFILLFEIIGAKIMFILENLDSFEVKDLSITGGFSLMGVYIFAPFMLILLALIFKKDILSMFDFFAPGVLIELAFYRVNCAISGCCGGISINGVVVPTQIIEICFDVIIFLAIGFIAKFKNSPKGFVFGLTYISYGVLRFIIEFFRQRSNLFWEISISHIFSLVMIMVGIIFIVISSKKGKLNERP